MKTRLQKALILAAILGGTAAVALADAHDPVAQREAKMGVMGKSARTIGGMLKGEAPFDAAVANETLVAMRDAAQGFGDLFPEGTELAGENENAAGPAIWTDRAGFEAELAKLQTALQAAVDAAPQDQAALGAAFAAVGQECQACHEKYRVKK